MGPAKITAFGKKFKKKFWKEVFSSVMPIMEGAILNHPNKMLSASFCNNFLFIRNRVIKKTDFPDVSKKYHPSSARSTLSPPSKMTTRRP